MKIQIKVLSIMSLLILPALIVQTGLVFYGYCSAAEVETRIQGINRDASASREQLPESKFVLVPIPVSNPTVGVGLTLAGIYLHGREQAEENGPTTTTGLGVMYTNNESWLIGAFHDGYYFNDFMRLNLAAGYGELHLKYYGTGTDSIFQENPLEFKATSSLFLPRLLFELPWDNVYLGMKYVYVGIENALDLPRPPEADLPEFSFRTDTAGLGLVGVYDSRDNNLWPNAGSWLELTGMNYGGHFGGDYHYNKGIIKFSQYYQITAPLVFVYRLDGQFISGDAPFWDLAQINLRGFPFGRYLDDNSATAQIETRWNVYKNWTLTVFGGGGRIAGSISDIGSTPTRWAGGAGVRYNVGGKHKLNIGIDLTYAEDQVEVYFQIGDWLTR